jgi:hypothetical protein
MLATKSGRLCRILVSAFVRQLTRFCTRGVSLTSRSRAIVGTAATYAYNGDGLRMSKTVNGTTTQQTWNTAEGLPLLIQDGTIKEIDGLGGLPLEQITGNGRVSYDIHDQLGSTRELVASGGQIVTFYAYDAYGTLQTSSISPGIDGSFPTRRDRDEETSTGRVLAEPLVLTSHRQDVTRRASRP